MSPFRSAIAASKEAAMDMLFSIHDEPLIDQECDQLIYFRYWSTLGSGSCSLRSAQIWATTPSLHCCSCTT